VPYKLVIFDFDGTLADSGDWLMGLMNEVADRYGFRRLSDAEIAMLRGQDNRAIIRYLGVPAWKLPLIARHMRRRAVQDASGIRLFDGAEAMLRALAERGVTLALVTSNAEQAVHRVLGPDCAALIGSYECGASIFGKAAKFRRVLRRTGLPKEAVIGIGDESRDIEAARKAGIACGAVAWGYATPELLARQRPDLLFHRMEEIVERLIA
jgi:phosphoglycolate phosphatase